MWHNFTPFISPSSNLKFLGVNGLEHGKIEGVMLCHIHIGDPFPEHYVVFMVAMPSQNAHRPEEMASLP